MGKAALAIDGAIGFDTAVPLTANQVSAYVAQGYNFCVRYVSRTDATREWNLKHGTADLSSVELGMILKGGLTVMAVQHVATHGWVPAGALGLEYGTNAAKFALDAGLSPGVTLWLDLEDLPQGIDHQEVIDYCNAWFDQVEKANYQPGVYIGFNVWLSADELFFRLKTQHYWRAAGHITDVAHRGYQMFQHVFKPDGKHEFDQNLIKADAMGGLPTWMEK